jgi:hypothetical protein
LARLKTTAFSSFKIVSLKLKPQEKCLFLEYLYLYPREKLHVIKYLHVVAFSRKQENNVILAH